MERVALADIAVPLDTIPEKLIGIDEALERLAEQLPDAAEIVRLRYFVGLSIEEAAEVQGISRATAYRHWTFAKAWLQAEFNEKT